jgi:predicted ATPase/signal transduction histidine kinase
MTTFTGYTLQQRIHRSTAHVVYRGRRDWDGLPVILKCPAARFPSPRDVARLQREYAALKRLGGRGAPTAICLEAQDQGMALVTADVDGRTLATLMQRGPLDTAAFLDVALACCDALAHVHGAGLVHKNLTPTNILITPTGDARVIDLAAATSLSTAGGTEGPALLEGTPAYMAPEQTGRVNRPIDHRSDHYGLGATFYELLCGQPPFQGEDTLDLVLAHISRPPAPPHVHNPRVPPVLSAIVLKLLAKEPEERYQSLRGLRADLDRCAESLRASGALPHDLEIGGRDRSDVFRLSQRLYGRQAEKEALAAALQRAAGGRTELVLVHGPSGIGKTALVREVFRPVSGRRGAFVSGKFEEFRRNAPYGAMIGAFSQYMRGLLAGSEEDLVVMRDRIRRALGPQAGVLTAVVPELEIIIGAQPRVPVLSAMETENRVTRVFRALIGAVAGPAQPLVLFLDDLQWADRSTLHLLQQVLIGRGQRHVLIIGAFRDIGGDANHPLAFLLDRLRSADIPVSEIALAPLGQAETEALIVDSLGCDRAAAAPLAALCLDKTGGNPFFLSRFLTSLHETDHIRFDEEHEAWDWRIEEIAALDITDNVVDLVVEKIERLSPSCRRVLQRAACIGGTFDLDTLSRINDVGPRETVAQLWEALTEGLAVPIGTAYLRFREATQGPDIAPGTDTGGARGGAEGGGGGSLREGEAGQRPLAAPLSEAPSEAVRFRFLHDRVHQAVYGMIAAEERGLRHLNIGRLLLDSATTEELNDHLFDILDQLNRGAAHLRDDQLSRRIAGLNLLAARKARAAAAYDSALTYARAGLDTLGEAGWASDLRLMLDLGDEAAEASYMLGDLPLMSRLIAEIERHARDTVDKAKALRLKVVVLTRANDYAGALEAAFLALDDLGRPLRARGLAVGGPLLRGRLRLLASRLDKTVGILGRDFDPTGEAAMRILIAIFPTLALSYPRLLAVATERLMGLAAESARPLYIAVAHAAYATVLSRDDHVEGAIRHGNRAAALAAEHPDSDLHARITLLTLVMAAHWREPLRSVRDRLTDVYGSAAESGDMETAGYAIAAYLEAGLQCGIDLADLERGIAFAREAVRHHNNAWPTPYLDAVTQALDNLTRPSDNPARLDGEHYDETTTHPRLMAQRNILVLVHTRLITLQLAVIFGRHAEARQALKHIDQQALVFQGSFASVSATFYGAIVYCRDPASGSAQRRLSRVRRAIRKLRKWSTHGTANTLHRLQALMAEEARLTSHTLRAAESYDVAIKTAHENGFIHEEAMINEFAAEFHEQRGRPMIASAYRRQAHYNYRLWGAVAKAAAMEEEWSDLADLDDPVPGVVGDRQGRHGIDIAAVMKATQAITGEIHRPRLLENLLRITLGTAGAHRGLLILRNEDGWSVAAEGEAGADSFTLHRTNLRLEDPGMFSAPGPMEGRTAGEEPQDEEDEPAFSRAIFNYVARAREAVVLHNAPEEGPFTADPYVLRNHPRSVLCLPLFQQSDLKGMLYLENNLATGAFTAERLEVLHLLAAQVAISLDNAVLYENLAELNRNLERQVAERTREATEKSRLLEATLDSMSDGLVACDADERLLVWNDRAVSLFRVPPELRRRGVPYVSVIEATLAAGVMSPRLAQVVRDRLNNHQPPLPDQPSAEMELADGSRLQIRRMPMPDGGQVHVFLDVTEERRRENELVAARQAAERALHDLQETQESLIQAEKMASLGQLVAGVAHEINTPVGITLTAASFLRERAEVLQAAVTGDGLRKSQLLQFVDQSLETTSLMVANIQRAADLIHSFKQVAVDQTSGERRHFQVAAYIDEVLRSFGPMLRKTAHTVVVDCPDGLAMESYPGALSQVLTNLMMNAVTHAFDEGVAGRLDIVVRAAGPDAVDLAFSDNGRGIPADLQPRVFDPFYTTRRGRGGSGLGLNIVFNLVNSVLGGTVTLTSRTAPEKGPTGTTFTLHLPLVAPVMRVAETVS